MCTIAVNPFYFCVYSHHPWIYSQTHIYFLVHVPLEWIIYLLLVLTNRPNTQSATRTYYSHLFLWPNNFHSFDNHHMPYLSFSSPLVCAFVFTSDKLQSTAHSRVRFFLSFQEHEIQPDHVTSVYLQSNNKNPTYKKTLKQKT